MMELILGAELADLLSMDKWGGRLLDGLINTVKIAIGGYLLGLLIGIFGAFGKLYGNIIVRDLLSIYTTVVRAVPELVLILLLYYAGNSLLNILLKSLGFEATEIDGFVAGVFVIGIVQGAYSTEVIRGSILAISHGQIEAARSFGMSSFKILIRITIPAMLPFAISGLANLWLIATKDTALLSVVGFTELTLTTKQAAGSTKHYFTFYSITMALYLTVTLGSSFFIRKLEKRVRRGIPDQGN